MTDQKANSNLLDLTAIALKLFTARMAHSQCTPEALVRTCFRDAKAFITGAADILTSGVDVFAEDNNPLDVAFAPNLKKTHPLNLMSRAWGDLKLVQNALAELEANPVAESYEPYGWGKPEVNQARVLFCGERVRVKGLLLSISELSQAQNPAEVRILL